jgi:hypothetical protein
LGRYQPIRNYHLLTPNSYNHSLGRSPYLHIHYHQTLIFPTTARARMSRRGEQHGRERRRTHEARRISRRRESQRPRNLNDPVRNNTSAGIAHAAAGPLTQNGMLHASRGLDVLNRRRVWGHHDSPYPGSSVTQNGPSSAYQPAHGHGLSHYDLAAQMQRVHNNYGSFDSSAPQPRHPHSGNDYSHGLQAPSGLATHTQIPPNDFGYRHSYSSVGSSAPQPRHPHSGSDYSHGLPLSNSPATHLNIQHALNGHIYVDGLPIVD